MLAHAPGKRLYLAHRMRCAVDHDMVERIRQAGKVALRVDHDLLDEPGGLFEQAAQKVRLAGTRVALDEQSRREQFLDIDANALPGRIRANFDLRCHMPYE